MTTAIERARLLSCWTGPVSPVSIKGGITNANFLVNDAGKQYFVRIGDDIPVHGVMRFNELAASRAAALSGLSPNVRHHEQGAIVFDFVTARTLSAADVRSPAMLARILPLIRRCHREMPKHIRGPALIFWVFHVIRDYAHSLREGQSRHTANLPQLMEAADTLERATGPVEIVYCHNDLLPTNFLDSGDRLWLIDWDYAGFNSPLFDLGNLCSNNEITGKQELGVIESYFERKADAALLRSYGALKCASLLREAMWSMISELHSTLDFDYAAYTAENMSRFQKAYDAFKAS